MSASGGAGCCESDSKDMVSASGGAGCCESDSKDMVSASGGAGCRESDSKDMVSASGCVACCEFDSKDMVSEASVVLSGGVGFDCKDVVSEASAGAVTACRSVSCVAFARSTASVRLGWLDPVWVLLRWWFDLAWALPRLSVPLRGRVVCAAFHCLLFQIRCCALVLEHWKMSHHSRG